MWCPSCGAEYRPGFTRCPDCDVDLVTTPPTEPETTEPPRATAGIDRLGPDPKAVYVGPPPEADLMRAVLVGSGIEAIVWHSGMENSYGAIMPNRVLVPAEDAERAAEIIVAARAGELDLDDEADDDGDDAEALGTEEGWDFGDPPSSDPIGEVVPWWRHPELSALLSAARVVLFLGVIVGLAYLIFTTVAD